MGERESLQVFNVLFNKVFRTLKYIQHNRSNFNPNAKHLIPQYKLEVWPGYIVGADMYEGGLLLQCEIARRFRGAEPVG